MAFTKRSGLRHPDLPADERQFYIKLGIRLREYRLSLDMNLKEASSELGIDDDTLSDYERGFSRPTPFMLVRMSYLYAVHLADIYG